MDPPLLIEKWTGDLLTWLSDSYQRQATAQSHESPDDGFRERTRIAPALIRMAGLSACITSPASNDAGRLQINVR